LGQRFWLVGAGAGAQRDQRVGFLTSRSQDSTWPMIFEGTADHLDVIGEQRRGQRIAGKA